MNISTKTSILFQLRSLVEQQEYTKLKQQCIQTITANKEPSVLPLLALAQIHLGERSDAQETLQQAEQQIEHMESDAKVDLAAVYFLQHKPEKALSILNPLLNKEPDHAMALARRALCHIAMGANDPALADVEKAAKLDPERMALWIQIAQLKLQQEEYQSALEAVRQGQTALQKRLNSLPEHTVHDYQQQFAQLQLRCWVGLESFSEAESWLQEQQVDEEKWLQYLSLYAMVLAENDQHAQAEELLREGLKTKADSVPLLMQLAELAQLQGHFMQAVTLLQRAIKLEEDNPLLWVRLSAAALHRFDQRARTAAEKAVELADALTEDKDNPLAKIKALRLQAKNALAQVESQEQNFELSEKLFREVLEENEYFMPALQGLGQQLMQQGQLDEATRLFERMKKIDPVRGYSALINARQFPEDEKTLERMEKSARLPSLEGKVSSGILFQLASAWEKRKDYDKAIELAHEANQSSKRFLPYDAKVHRNSCARIRYAFSKSLYEHRKDCGYRGENESLPVFVLGMPRSGTTLVEQILSGHSEIFGAGELGVIPSRIQGLNRWERHTGSGRSYPDCIDDLNAKTAQGIAKGIISELQEFDPSAKHIVDKLPHNFENIGLIKFLFPKAKIISVRRDPRDIALSNYFTDYQAKHGGMGFAYDLKQIGEQLADHNLLMHHWHQLFPDEILEINYEDVVNDLESSAHKMLDYIGVNWEPQVLAFNELERTVKTASVWQVRQPIYKTSTAKWKRYQQHLPPLVEGTNAKIEWEPIEMLTLPEAGMLTDGVELYHLQKLDEAEYSFKKLLHHIPDHAAANYMTGLIYLNKNHLLEGIELIEKAREKCPWQKEWRENLIQAYRLSGQSEKAQQLEQKYTQEQSEDSAEAEPLDNSIAFSLPTGSQAKQATTPHQ